MVKSGDQIFDGGVEFFATECTSGDKDAATRLTRKNMSGLAYWKTHHFPELDGPAATDAEFGTAMAKLM